MASENAHIRKERHFVTDKNPTNSNVKVKNDGGVDEAPLLTTPRRCRQPGAGVGEGEACKWQLPPPPTTLCCCHTASGPVPPCPPHTPAWHPAHCTPLSPPSALHCCHSSYVPPHPAVCLALCHPTPHTAPHLPGPLPWRHAPPIILDPAVIGATPPHIYTQ